MNAISRLEFAEYVSLGDSMSIDLFPALDAGLTDVSVALERDPTVGHVAPIGAASLFHRNDEEVWPEETGNDLETRYPGIAFRQLASHGATIGDVFGEQLPALGESDVPTVLTLTIGSEDLFSAFSGTPKAKLLARIISDLAEAYDLLVEAIRRARPRSTLLVTTICDPSDRIGRIRGVLDDMGQLPLGSMDKLNVHIRTLAGGTPGVALADAYIHFLGHGQSDDEAERWYWRRSPLEPNKRGAHELRMVWLDALRRETQA